MPNITFSVDGAALANAKAFAAARSTSLNKLINAFLASLGRQHSRTAVSRIEEALLDFSVGKTNLIQTAERLDLPDAGYVFALMQRVGLPLPELPESEIDRQVKQSLEFLRKALRSKQRRKSRSAAGK